MASKLFPQGLITGTVPASVQPSNKGKPIEVPDKHMFSRDDVFALLDLTEASCAESNAGSKY